MIGNPKKRIALESVFKYHFFGGAGSPDFSEKRR